ncbi:hypothetical protein Mapa_010671 [Marchantia paleacea]|nr:hypothetical protein Mapa_010671 [Marchantia paleacea]
MVSKGRWTRFEDLGSSSDSSSSGEREQPRRNQRKRHVLVIGGGVSGLTTAWKLLEANFRVTVLAKDYAPAAPRIVSEVAGALWEWPPAVCGKHTDATSLERSKKWCMVSYNHFSQMAEDHELSLATGVRMRVANFFFDKPISEDAETYKKVQELKNSGVKCVRHGFELIEEELGQGAHSELKDAYQHLAPVIDTDQYMRWLTCRVVSLGAELRHAESMHCLLDIEAELLHQFKADAIINCTGLGAIVTAADDNVYPLRGCLIRVKNDGSSMPKVSKALCVPHDDSKAGTGNSEDLVFIVPRSEEVLILGGSVEPNEWGLDLNLDNSALVRAMLDRCVKFLPGLKNAELIDDYPVAVGLRPFRKGNVRVEAAGGPSNKLSRRSGSRIVHNYGHGGSGFTLSHGFAEEVVQIVQRMLEIQNPLPSRIADYKLPGTDSTLKDNIARVGRKTRHAWCARAVGNLLDFLESRHKWLRHYFCCSFRPDRSLILGGIQSTPAR